MKIGKFLIGAGLAMVLGVSAVRADTVKTFAGDYGDLSAQVVFKLTGSTLSVTVTNTASVAAQAAGDTLTGVYWNDNSAIGGLFSKVAMGINPITSVQSFEVGSSDQSKLGYFAYGGPIDSPGVTVHDLNNSVNVHVNYGVTSAGIFSQAPLLYIGNTDPGTSPKSPDGPPGGLISSANNGVYNGKLPVIEDTLVYTIDNVSITSLDGIRDVEFQYGTATSEPAFNGGPVFGVNPIPLPSSVWAGFVLLGLLGVRRYMTGRAA